jgi:hypothetical protein
MRNLSSRRPASSRYASHHDAADGVRAASLDRDEPLQDVDETKRRCLGRLADFTCARFPLRWGAAITEEIVAAMARIPFPMASRPAGRRSKHPAAKETADGLRYSSKFNRRRDFVDVLRLEGRTVAQDWLKRWPNNGCYPDDAAYRKRQ